MSALSRRVRKLETQQSCTPVAHLRCHRLAEVLWERRQRRLKAEGLPFETIKPQYSQVHICRVLKLCECVGRNVWHVSGANGRPPTMVRNVFRRLGRLVCHGREAPLTRSIARRLEQLETRAKEVAAARPEPRTLCFIEPVNKRVVSTYEMGTGEWTHFVPPSGPCGTRADSLAADYPNS